MHRHGPTHLSLEALTSVHSNEHICLPGITVTASNCVAWNENAYSRTALVSRIDLVLPDPY